MAKHTTVMATRETRYGITIRALCSSGRGFWNRLREIRSMGPMRMSDRVVFRVGSRMVEAAWLYKVMGEKLAAISRVRSWRRMACGSEDCPGEMGEITSAA